jgi:hypothetical protein
MDPISLVRAAIKNMKKDKYQKPIITEANRAQFSSKKHRKTKKGRKVLTRRQRDQEKGFQEEAETTFSPRP